MCPSDARSGSRRRGSIGATLLLTLFLACASRDPNTDGRGSNLHFPESIKVRCQVNTTHHSDVPDCQCTSQGGSGATFVTEGDLCSGLRSDAPTRSCADLDYPRKGSCSYWELPWWRCRASGNSCECAFIPFQNGVVSVCNNEPIAGGSPWQCCLADQDCTCEKGSVACPANAVPVDDCSSYAKLGLAAPPAACPADQHEVSTCVVSPTGEPASSSSAGDDDCPGDCRDDGIFVCCPLRGSDGICTMGCCDSSGCF